ncbi:MAG: OsmC family protein [Bacteroidetes bacterium]|nr:OsmC family protein [Bacteroidota bacterium]
MTKQVQLKQIKGNTYAVKGDSNHWIVLDTKKESGGHEAGPAPKELLLMALAGCTSMDVILILKKKRVSVDDYECYVKGIEQEKYPKIFSEIHIEYVFYGQGIKPGDVEQAIELSKTKYCSVSIQLSASAKITHSYRIEPAYRQNE